MGDFTHYEKDGRKYERYSTVASFFMHPDLVDWKVRVGKAESGKIKRAALKTGTKVDGYCEDDWRGKGYKIKKSDSQEVVNCMKAWEAWKRDYPERFMKIVGMQETYYYDDLGVACTLDIHEWDGITDIKTSKQVGIIYWVQIALQNRQLKLPNKRVLRLDKMCGAYEYVKCPEEYSQEYLEQIFVGMLNVFNFFKSEGECDA